MWQGAEPHPRASFWCLAWLWALLIAAYAWTNLLTMMYGGGILSLFLLSKHGERLMSDLLYIRILSPSSKDIGEIIGWIVAITAPWILAHILTILTTQE
jgi:hypothetical protein